MWPSSARFAPSGTRSGRVIRCPCRGWWSAGLRVAGGSSKRWSPGLLPCIRTRTWSPGRTGPRGRRRRWGRWRRGRLSSSGGGCPPIVPGGGWVNRICWWPRRGAGVTGRWMSSITAAWMAVPVACRRFARRWGARPGRRRGRIRAPWPASAGTTCCSSPTISGCSRPRRWLPRAAAGAPSLASRTSSPGMTWTPRSGSPFPRVGGGSGARRWRYMTLSSASGWTSSPSPPGTGPTREPGCWWCRCGSASARSAPGGAGAVRGWRLAPVM